MIRSMHFKPVASLEYFNVDVMKNVFLFCANVMFCVAASCLDCATLFPNAEAEENALFLQVMHYSAFGMW